MTARVRIAAHRAAIGCGAIGVKSLIEHVRGDRLDDRVGPLERELAVAERSRARRRRREADRLPQRQRCLCHVRGQPPAPGLADVAP